MRRLLHYIFSFPFFYNQMQVFFGVNKKKALVGKHYAFAHDNAVILDLAGGTGLYRDLWPGNYRYICLDNDPVKLKGLLKECPNDAVLLGDAVKIPLKDQSVDVVFCSSFSHHVTEDILEQVFKETTRVLKKSGKLLFFDALLRQKSFLNRFLWSLDRGSHPHTLEQLSYYMEKYFKLDISVRFSKYYDYIFFIGDPRK